MKVDVAIIGGGPAGLATAIHVARAGLTAAVFERQPLPADKACGEGVMPYGVRALERMGVRELIDPRSAKAFGGIRYIDASGATAEATLKSPGLGVRRLALSTALAQRARAVGAQLFERSQVAEFEVHAQGVALQTSSGAVEAQLLVAADGLHSPTRKKLGLQLAATAKVRYGLRQHFRVEPWCDCVEVHIADGVEAYVTPVGAEHVGVGFLWEKDSEKSSVEAMLARFPRLSERLRSAETESTPRGAGPFVQVVKAPVANRVVLIGDAAGYVDAITGEGLSMAFESAELLAAVLPRALAAGAQADSLAPYARGYRRAFKRYANLAHAVLAISRRPRLRRAVLPLFGRFPRIFSAMVHHALPRGQTW